MRKKNATASREHAKRHHATSGALVGQGAAVSGSAARTRHHAASGALVAQGAAVNKRGLYDSAITLWLESGRTFSGKKIYGALQSRGEHPRMPKLKSFLTNLSLRQQKIR